MSAPLTSETAVRESIATSLDSRQVVAFIKDAHVWVSEELTGQGLSDTRMEVIERYLACALIRVRDLGLKSAQLENVKEEYQVDKDVTDYLLRAASFDSTGKVRQAFLTPAEGGRPVVFATGTTFKDEPEVVE